jgi:hypothetical protein
MRLAVVPAVPGRNDARRDDETEGDFVQIKFTEERVSCVTS